MSAQLGPNRHVILCDMCVDEDRKPAQKSCMKCEISMCAEHLKPHLTTPVLLQTHLLTEPVTLGSIMKCPQHGKLLEYYCLDDLTCVCVSCAIEDQHRLHNMKTFSTAHRELKEKLAAEQESLRTRTSYVSLEQWVKVETEKVMHSSAQLIKAVSKLRNLALTKVQNSVSARMVSLKTSKDQLQAAQDEADTFRFLQMYSEVHQGVEKVKALDLRPGMEPVAQRLKLLQELSQNNGKMVAQAQHFWRALVVLVDPESEEEIFSAGSNLTFDPKSSDPCMTLSRDQRKIFYSQLRAPTHLTNLFHILNSDPKAPIQRWALRLSSDYDWTIGLHQDTNSGRHNYAIFGLCYKGKQLSSLPGGERHDVSRPDHVTNPPTYEVMWRHSGSLTFFSLAEEHQRREITTIKIDPSLNNLAPFVRFEVKPLKAIQGAFGYESRREWRCLCGKVYYLHDNYLQQSYRSFCTCGKLKGGVCTTDLLCELL